MTTGYTDSDSNLRLLSLLNKPKEEQKTARFVGNNFMLEKSISKFSLDEGIVKNIIKLGYTEEFIHNEVENEDSYIGKLYRKLYELKKQLMKGK